MPSISNRVATPNERHNKDLHYRKHLPNVDPELSKYNVAVRVKSVEQIYQEHLQPAFEKFNAEQTRSDRRLDVKWNAKTYLEYQRALDKAARASKNNIGQKGKPPIREIVWQFGNPEQGYGCLNQTAEKRLEAYTMLMEVQNEAERRYPNLVWGDVTFHADETTVDANDKELGTMHLHSSFVPLCFKNKQGPDVQVAMERCLHEMGFATFTDWKHDLDNIMEEVLERHGLERTYMNNHNKHQDSGDFHRQQEILRKTKEMNKALEAAKEEKEKISSEMVEIYYDRENMIQNINQDVEEIYEESISSIGDVYSDALVYLANCSDEEFEEISDKGAQMAAEIAGERKTALDAVIKNVNASSVPPTLSWEERQVKWKEYREASNSFWNLRDEYNTALTTELTHQYDERTRVNRDIWRAKRLLSESPFIMGKAVAVVYLCVKKSELSKYERSISQIKKEQRNLQKMVSEFSSGSREWREALKRGESPTESLMTSTKVLIEELDKEADISIGAPQTHIDQDLVKNDPKKYSVLLDKVFEKQLEACKVNGTWHFPSLLRTVNQLQSSVKFVAFRTISFIHALDEIFSANNLSEIEKIFLAKQLEREFTERLIREQEKLEKGPLLERLFESTLGLFDAIFNGGSYDDPYHLYNDIDDTYR